MGMLSIGAEFTQFSHELLVSFWSTLSLLYGRLHFSTSDRSCINECKRLVCCKLLGRISVAFEHPATSHASLLCFWSFCNAGCIALHVLVLRWASYVCGN